MNSLSKCSSFSGRLSSVGVGPGQTALQRSPVPAYWMAMFLVSPMTPYLEAE